ncbi:MAG TPA: hypothetical protein VJW93_07715 [Candidatus Acidoferrales bacterium]|nr:hypothetical protein [Candidatus Acidoferrales bacterium]
MTSNTRSWMTKAVLLATILQAASAQTPQQPVTANLCEVVASPGRYNGKVLSVEGILLPGEHFVLLYSPSCKPKEGFDVRVQAVFPPEWVSSPNGKQLHRLFNQGKNASVKLIGTFESGNSSYYGTDAAPFRFTIREISSVKKAAGGRPFASGLKLPVPLVEAVEVRGAALFAVLAKGASSLCFGPIPSLRF